MQSFSTLKPVILLSNHTNIFQIHCRESWGLPSYSSKFLAAGKAVRFKMSWNLFTKVSEAYQVNPPFIHNLQGKKTS